MRANRPAWKVTKKIAAYYEAGHVVMAILLGEVPDAVLIRWSGGYNRQWEGEFHLPAGGAERLAEISSDYPVIMLQLGGPVAASIVRGCKLWDNQNLDDDNGWLWALATKRKLVPYLVGISRIVRRLLRENWPQVEALATALIRRKHLNRAEIRQIFCQSTAALHPA